MKKKTLVMLGLVLAALWTTKLVAGILDDVGRDAARKAEDKATNKVLNEPQNAAAAAVGGGQGGGVQVEWHGAWYPAHILKTNGNKSYIHYDGYSDSWNEWVGPSRMRK